MERIKWRYLVGFFLLLYGLPFTALGFLVGQAASFFMGGWHKVDDLDDWIGGQQ